MNTSNFLKKIKNKIFITFFNQIKKKKIHGMFTKCKIVNPTTQKNKLKKGRQIKNS